MDGNWQHDMDGNTMRDDDDGGFYRKQLFVLASEAQKEMRTAFVQGVFFGIALFAFWVIIYVLIFR